MLVFAVGVEGLGRIVPLSVLLYKGSRSRAFFIPSNFADMDIDAFLMSVRSKLVAVEKLVGTVAGVADTVLS